jgi:succinate dehydrogenase/fumarate reductase flavoprotein subunit
MSGSVVVVGSGAAGMAAAVSAARSGASVTLLEKAPLLGGTTAWGGGGIWIPANPWAAAEGHPDTEAAALTYLEHLHLGDTDRELAQRYVSQGARVVRAVEQATPLRWNTIQNFPDYHAELPGGKPEGGRSLEIDSVEVGPEVLREMRPNPYGGIAASRREVAAGLDAGELDRRQRRGIVGKGVGVVAAMCTTARGLGARVVAGRQVDRLLSSDGAVVGVEAGGEEFRGRVVVATGGFERDPALVRAFLRGPMTAPGSPPTNRGDGLKMGMAVGAALGNMSEAWWAPAMEVVDRKVDGAPFYWLLLGAIRAAPGGIIVDQHGRRFADEAANYNDFGRSMHEFDPASYQFPRSPSWLVFDAERRRTGAVGPLEPNHADPDWLVCSPSIEALAGRLNMQPSVLRATVERYNGHSARGVDEDFGRGSYAWDRYSAGFLSVRDQLRPLSEPPFYALQVQVGCLGTKGGLKIDEHARVLKADGSGTIEGLYAAGNAAANPFGMAYPSGGATVGPALVFGWLAGEAAAGA